MSKVYFHPSLAKLSVKEFKKVLHDAAPDEDESWEKHYKSIGGKVVTPKEDQAK
jgi:hypothetical protein